MMHFVSLNVSLNVTYSYFLNSVRREECVPTWHDNPVRLLNVDTCPGQNFTNSGYHRQNHSGDIVRI